MNVMTKPEAGTASIIKPTSLIGGTFVSTDIKRTRRLCENVLNLECVEPAKGKLLVREKGHRPGEKLHGQSYWVLEVEEVPEVLVEQEMLNHWGVAVPSQAAVDEAFEKVSAGQDEYDLGRVQKPRFRHGSYAFYFVDADTNWWEVEYRTPELVYTAIRERGDQA